MNVSRNMIWQIDSARTLHWLLGGGERFSRSISILCQPLDHKERALDILTGKHQPYKQHYGYLHGKYVKKELTMIIGADAVMDPWAMTIKVSRFNSTK